MVLEVKSFIAELRREVTQRNSWIGPHPLSKLLLEGKLTRPQVQAWATQKYIRQSYLTRSLARVIATCPDIEGRAMLTDQLYEEETGGISKTKCHTLLFEEFCEQLGITRQQLHAAEPLPTTTAFIHWTESLSFKSFAEGGAALTIAGEGASEQAMERLATTFRRHYGVKDTEFYEVHERLEKEHTASGDRIIERYVTTEEMQTKVRRAVIERLEVSTLFNDGIYRHYVLGENL